MQPLGFQWRGRKVPKVVVHGVPPSEIFYSQAMVLRECVVRLAPLREKHFGPFSSSYPYSPGRVEVAFSEVRNYKQRPSNRCLETAFAG